MFDSQMARLAARPARASLFIDDKLDLVEFFTQSDPVKRLRVRYVLAAIILATLPCYLTGYIAAQWRLSQTPTSTPSATATLTLTSTGTSTSTITSTATLTSTTTPSATATFTQTHTPSFTPQPTATLTRTHKPTKTSTSVPPTDTPFPTETPSPTP